MKKSNNSSEAAASSRADSEPSTARLKWFYLVLATLFVLAAACIAYDIILPRIQEQQLRKVVSEEIHLGDTWSSVEPRLLKRNAVVAKTYTLGDGSCRHVLVSSHESLTLGWARAILKTTLRDREAWLWVRPSAHVGVDTSGTVYRVLPN